MKVEERILHLSSAHITPEVCDMLTAFAEGNHPDALKVYWCDGECIIELEDAQAILNSQLPLPFRDCVQYAVSHKYGMIKFGCNEPERKELMTYRNAWN